MRYFFSVFEPQFFSKTQAQCTSDHRGPSLGYIIHCLRPACLFTQQSIKIVVACLLRSARPVRWLVNHVLRFEYFFVQPSRFLSNRQGVEAYACQNRVKVLHYRQRRQICLSKLRFGQHSLPFCL